MDIVMRGSLLLLAAWILAGCGVRDYQLSMVTPRLEIDQELAEEFARLFSDPEFIRIDLVGNPDTTRAGFHAVKTGVADLALVSNTETYDPELATVVPLYPTVLHMAYRSDEPVDDLISLVADATVYAGPPGSASRQLLEAAALSNGIEPDEINYVSGEGFCADLIIVYAPVLRDLPERIGTCGEYRLFSLGSPDQIGSGSPVDSITLLNPKLRPFVIPEDTYGALTPEPVVTLAVDKLLVASIHLPETVVYDLLREVLRLKPALSAKHPGLFHELTDDFDISGSAFVLHPGALAYLRRDEPDIYERYSGVAEVLVTLMIGLVSGIYAVLRIFRFRRKNRIDAFCRRVIHIRDSAADSGQARAEAVEALKALQDEAYDLMIHEKLSADESFRIFITLCNDTIADLKGASPTPAI